MMRKMIKQTDETPTSGRDFGSYFACFEKSSHYMRRQRSDFSSSSTADIDALCCPLTLETFRDPVILIGDGHTYERERIAEWLSTHDASPLTGENLPDADSRRLVPNHAVRKMVAELLEAEEDEPASELPTKDPSPPPSAEEKTPEKWKPPPPSRRKKLPAPVVSSPTDELPPSPTVPQRRPPPPLPPTDRSAKARSYPPPLPPRKSQQHYDDEQLALQLARDEWRLDEEIKARREALCKLDEQKARELARADG